MSWRDLSSAPRDRRIWLFLPSASWKSDAQGRPYEVTHAAVVANWSPHGWVNTLGANVYPSLWSDADVSGAAPEFPDSVSAS